jgi:hypothetical protein
LKFKQNGVVYRTHPWLSLYCHEIEDTSTNCSKEMPSPLYSGVKSLIIGDVANIPPMFKLQKEFEPE